MKKRNVDKALQIGVMVCFGMVAVSFLLMMPVEGPSNVLGLLAGICFWLFLLGGTVCNTVLSFRRRAWEKMYPITKRKFIGLVRFFGNRPAVVADIALPVCLLGLILSLWLTDSSGMICYVFLSLTVASFAAHCICNGKNYRYVFGK